MDLRKVLPTGRYQDCPLELKLGVQPHTRTRPAVPEETNPGRDRVKIHDLSVARYGEMYHSVLTPAALSALPTHNPADYMAQVLELKQRLWVALHKPQLLEKEGEDGRVHITEMFDLT